MSKIIISNSRGTWATGASYAVGDLVMVSGYPVQCLTAHTAGTYATDVQNGYWQLAYQTRNRIINGNPDVWQRGTSIAPGTGAYTADRWYGFRQGGVTGSTVSRQAGPTGSLNCARIQRDSGNTSTAQVEFISALETIESVPLAGKPVTVSFMARAGANLSSTGSFIQSYIGTGQGTDQGVVSAWTGGAAVGTTSFALTTTWTKFQYTTTLASSVTQLRLDFNFAPTGTAGASDYFEISQIMLNEGPAPAQFSLAGGNITGELAMCQRFYEVVMLNAQFAAAGNNSVGAYFMAYKRSTPTLAVISGAFSSGTILLENPDARGFRLTCAGGSAGAVIAGGAASAACEL
jgi:hypothetical protein